jgi:hypothetical protein
MTLKGANDMKKINFVKTVKTVNGLAMPLCPAEKDPFCRR